MCFVAKYRLHDFDMDVVVHIDVKFANLSHVFASQYGGSQGGLAITREGSPLFKKMFANAPPSIVEGRPESVAIVLRWLIPKESFLYRVRKEPTVSVVTQVPCNLLIMLIFVSSQNRRPCPRTSSSASRQANSRTCRFHCTVCFTQVATKDLVNKLASPEVAAAVASLDDATGKVP
jgi:hypothetical protein